MVEPVRAGEPLTRWPATEQVHLPPQRYPLPPVIGLISLNSLSEKQVTIVTEDSTVRIVELVSLSCWLEYLDSPLALCEFSLVQTMAETSTSLEDIEKSLTSF